MEVVRWRPRRAVPALYGEWDRTFDHLLRSWPTPELPSEFSWNPRVDIAETDDEIVVKAEIPGVSKDDIDITVDNNQLILSGEKRQEVEEKEKNYYRVERSYGSFKRIFNLPSTADVGKVEAAYDDGVLTIQIPKTEVARGKKVEIRDS